MPEISKPHDWLFLEKLGDPKNAAHVLAPMFPPALSAMVDWQTLQRAPERYAPKHSDPRIVDLLFQFEIAGVPGFIYLLFEHQSKTQPLMPWRMLGYTVEIARNVLEQHPERTRLPVVIPALLCHGPTPWAHETRLLDCYDLPEALRPLLAPLLPDFSLLIEDLGAIPPEVLRARVLPPNVHLMLFSLQRMREGADLAEIGLWTPVFQKLLQEPGGHDALETLAWYILTVTDIQPQAFHDLLLPSIGEEASRTIMTTAEKLHAEGMEQGIEKGIPKGQARTLLKLLQLKFGALPPEVVDHIQAASSQQLDVLAERVLSIESLQQLLDD